jgi:hypothetical protein
MKLTLETTSKRGEEWARFAQLVLLHIDTYAVSQYGDEGDDIATSYTPEDALRNVDKYVQRYGRNQRGGEQARDFIKMAHYAQLAHYVRNRFKKARNKLMDSYLFEVAANAQLAYLLWRQK